MRLLFTMDAKDYTPGGTVFSRPSARGIILRGERLALVHALKHDYYKFPGGGIEPGEDPITALIREVKEESGLTVIPGSIREYGYVHRVEKGDPEDIFLQDNYYYFCQVESRVGAQALDPFEQEEGFALEYVSPQEALAKNLAVSGSGYQYRRMALREAQVLELLLDESFFSDKE